MENILFVLLRRLRSPLIVLICVYAVAILGFVLIPGVDDEGQPWRMDFFHAFYFVSFMGTTIGFGEIPYAFTPTQRMWSVMAIYASVTAWLYAIGAIFSLIQDPGIRILIRQSSFRLSVARLREPFYLICGYGDTGSFLVRALTECGIRSVVIDIDMERINALQIEDLKLHVPGLCADAAEPNNLCLGGLQHPHCAGVVALTNVDHVNLKIAITSKLLHPGMRSIARAETHDAEANIASFGTDHIVNPFDTFAGRLALALHSPGMYLLYEWMTSVPHEPLREPVYPPRGTWILCGYGRFGKAVYEKLTEEGVRTTIIEAEPETTEAPADTVKGRGTEAQTLLEAGVERAAGIVAGTDDDANNLSIIMTAEELNPQLFMVARQNQRMNDPIFQAAHLNLVMQRGSIIAHKIFGIITNPLLADFLRLARRRSNDWANELVSRIGGVSGDEAPHLWTIRISPNESPALSDAITRGTKLRLADLHRDPRNRDDRLLCIGLLLKRSIEEILLPGDEVALGQGDEILFCGPQNVETQMRWVTADRNVFQYVRTGEEQPTSYILRLAARRQQHDESPVN